MPVNHMWLDDVVAKFKRAEEHFDTIKREIGAWSETQPYRLVKKTNADKTRHTLVVRLRTRPPVQRWSVIVSDCLHNLRASLDYLVYAVAVEQSGKEPPPDFDKLQFPIADDPERFDKSKWRIQSLSPDVIAAIESVQPYNRRHPSLPPLLTILRDFDDVDKHRLLHVMLTKSQQMKLSDIRDFPDGSFLGAESGTSDVKDKTEIATLVFSAPAPDMKYEATADFVIAMTHAPGPVDSVPWSDVGSILIRIVPEVRTIIDIVSAKV